MGKIIQRYKKKETKKTFYETFIAHMNLLSKELKLDQTWGNSSGLSFNPNFSSPEAIIILTAIAIRNPIFHRIVNTKAFEIDIKNERFGITRKAIWRNTNKLL
jgi:D-alanyl-D-alanine carboxypeptidase